jgi:hypothetical protein
MRKDNAIFFLSGLVFGLLLGYFVFQSVSQTGGGMSVAVSPANPGSPMGGGGVSQPATSRRVVDPQEVAALESVLEQNPNDNSARVRLGNLYLEAGHDDQAISWFREALERVRDRSSRGAREPSGLVGIGKGKALRPTGHPRRPRGLGGACASGAGLAGSGERSR